MEKKRALVFVGIVYVLAILCTLPLFLYSSVLDQQMLQFLLMATGMVFMWLPVLAVFLTRKITGDPFKVALRPRFKRHWRAYLSACFLPGAAVCVGTALFFLLFPDKLDLTWGYVQATIGMTPPFAPSVPTLIGLGALLTLMAPLVFVNHILAFGEEFGWRGYLLYKLRSCMSERKAVLLSGALWGLVHAPLVCFGLNYNTGYPGFPLSGILMMIVFATVIGVWFSDLTLRTNSVIAPSIAHGALNAVREVPLFISVMGVNTLLGPKPSGIIGMAGLILLAAICLIRWRHRKIFYPDSYLLLNENYIEEQPGVESYVFATAYLLRHFGEDTDSLSLRKDFPSEDRVHPSDMEQFFIRRGYAAKFKTNGTIEDLKRLVSSGLPAIVLIHKKVPYKSISSRFAHSTHYLPIVGYDPDFLYFAESTESLANSKGKSKSYNHKIEISKFMMLWENIDGVWDFPYFEITNRLS